MTDEKHIREHILSWIQRISMPRNELGNFPVCPYAKEAKVEIKIVRSANLRIEDDSEFDVVIYVLENEIGFQELTNLRDSLNSAYPEFIFLDDHRTFPGYIQGVQTTNGMLNLLLKQRKAALIEARKSLLRAGYYSFWSQELIDDVLGDEYKEMLYSQIR